MEGPMTTDSSLCPRCGAQLSMQDLFTAGRHATIAACTQCGGQWIRDTDLQRLSEIIEPVMLEWRSLPSTVEQRAVLSCPECDGAPPLEKLSSDRDRHVVLDHCTRCGGVWLDANELKAIQRESLFALLAGFARRGA
jgi:uncharacterized protein